MVSRGLGSICSSRVVARSPDRATRALWHGLLTVPLFRRWHGRETVPQQGYPPVASQSVSTDGNLPAKAFIVCLKREAGGSAGKQMGGDLGLIPKFTLGGREGKLPIVLIFTPLFREGKENFWRGKTFPFAFAPSPRPLSPEYGGEGLPHPCFYLRQNPLPRVRGRGVCQSPAREV